MSVLVDLDSLSKDKINQFSEELEVKSLVNPRNKFAVQSVVQTYQMYKSGNKNFCSIPLGFFYHSCSTLKPAVTYKHSKITAKFNGSLLPRQDEIKNEALEILSRTSSILLCLHTGFGKTIFTLYLASRIKLKTVILCHRSIIIQQWMEAISKYLPSCTPYVLNVSDVKGSIDEHTFDTVDILVCNVINVSKLHKNVWKSFGTVVVDEVHTICTEQFSKALFSFFPSYLIGLSATPERSDGMDKILELYFGPEIIIRSMKRYFNAYKINTGFEPTVEMTYDNKINWNSVLESQAEDDDRNLLLCKLVWYFGNRNILVLVKRKDHALYLKRQLIAMGEDADCFIHTAKRVNYDCRVLIATYSKGGVGFDHPKLDMLITGADVEENFMQYLGRVFRRDDVIPIYIDCRDKMGTLVKHSTTRLRICKEVGGAVHDFEKTFIAFEQYTKHLVLKK